MKGYIRLFCFIIIGTLFLWPDDACAQTHRQQEIDTLTGRLQHIVLARKINKKELAYAMANMQPDGSWPDIDYNTVTLYYDAGRHLARLNYMAMAYASAGSEHCKSGQLLSQILLGLEYFYRQQPISKNWWHIDIGAPQDYMSILILLKGEIEKEKLLHYSSYLRDRTTNPSHQGKNRTWVSAITIHKGCIEDDYRLIQTGFQSIASTIRIISNSDEEGIKADYSIHQHRPQLYSGGYGMSLMEDLGRFIHLAQGLSFVQLFTPEKRDIVNQTMLQGQMMFGYRQSYDFGAIGRNISRPNGLANISTRSLDTMMMNDPIHKPAYQAWKEHVNGADFPQTGNKYFWKSAITTHHGKNYYLSAKIPSVRNNGTEMLNGENLKGYYLPLGATNIMTTSQEYKNIFPLWDWTRVPGTTAVANQSTAQLNWYHFGSNRFGGGVSNGRNGIIAYEHAYNGVQAWKSYFFFGDAMLCLGGGIEAAKTQTITTSVNQCFLQGDVYINRSGRTEMLSRERIKSDSLNWVFHNNVGYVFPYPGNVVVQQKPQSGSWRDINESGNPTVLTEKIFSLWAEHGNAPVDESYCYIVMPDRSLPEFEQQAGNHGFEILSNTSGVQAIRNTAMHNYGIVFYAPGRVELDKGLTIASDAPAIIYLEKTTAGYELSVADPLYIARSLCITINKRKIKIELPQDDYRGNAVTLKLKI
ncbi:polysaccharide lyase beta-sandwich domain-containing protein [Bacteroides sp. OttesenSCG-928-J23]|nr:polysaccharide lyase beta-sandwich domain-containing protein [Bacteroides sp. OttesenSCG-928-J23]MDL2304337.1 polysaccharide lyase beta-sandwich domain-containing protein [Bacteroides sp. OttesenSCG-928-D19]